MEDVRSLWGERDTAPCPICGGGCIPLPEPGPRCMISDGRCVARPLAKMSCTACGCVSHIVPPTEGGVRGTYGDLYTLSRVHDAASLRRGAAYADLILGATAVPANAGILDVGCGNGAMLFGFADRRPAARLAGLEAAGILASAARRDGRITISEGFAEDLPRPDQPFGLVCAVNVIEHCFDPRAFLEALARQVDRGGTVAIVCPRADRPNLELLFHDHVYTLSPTAMASLGSSAGLTLTDTRMAPSELGDFQLCILQSGESVGAQPLPGLDPVTLAWARHDYLQTWSRLDGSLLEAMGRRHPVSCFGASEAAALLCTYAPKVWARVGVLVVDEPDAAWNLGRPVRRYRPYRDGDPRHMLVAVHPTRQESVGERLACDGYMPILWPGAISR